MVFCFSFVACFKKGKGLGRICSEKPGESKIKVQGTRRKVQGTGHSVNVGLAVFAFYFSFAGKLISGLIEFY